MCVGGWVSSVPISPQTGLRCPLWEQQGLRVAPGGAALHSGILAQDGGGGGRGRHPPSSPPVPAEMASVPAACSALLRLWPAVYPESGLLQCPGASLGSRTQRGHHTAAGEGWREAALSTPARPGRALGPRAGLWAPGKQAPQLPQSPPQEPKDRGSAESVPSWLLPRCPFPAPATYLPRNVVPDCPRNRIY